MGCVIMASSRISAEEEEGDRAKAKTISDKRAIHTAQQATRNLGAIGGAIRN